MIGLKNRVKNFLAELGVPATKFCKNVNISYFSYQHWIRNMQKFSKETEKRISDYLEQYNF